MLVSGFSKWAGSTDKTTSNMDAVDIMNADKHEIFLMIAGFVIILLTAVCSFYRYKRTKTEMKVKMLKKKKKKKDIENRNDDNMPTSYDSD